MIQRTGHLKYALKNRLKPVIASQYIRYIKAIKRFEKISVSTQLIYWDEKYFYFKHVFTVKDQERAILYAKVLWLKKGGFEMPQKLMKALDFRQKPCKPQT